MTLIAMNPIQMLTRSVSRATSFKAGLTLVAVMCATASFAQGESGANNDLSTFVDPGASGANVDKATGAFSFSMPLMTLPGAAGEGYPMVLGYAPPSPDEPASWVGYGWSLGPGAVNRSVNGIPDDFNGIDITNISKTPVHHRLTLTPIGGLELFSSSAASFSLASISYDSQRGIMPAVNASVNAFGAGISYMQSGGEGQFSASFSPLKAAMSIAALAKNSNSSPESLPQDAPPKANDQEQADQHNTMTGREVLKEMAKRIASNKIYWSPKTMAMPTYQNGVRSQHYTGNVSGQFAPFADMGFESGFSLNYDRTVTQAVDSVTAYGYLHSDEVQPTDGATSAAMDFFEERPHTLDEYDTFLPLPVQMPDHFSVSAGTLSGQFRAHFTQPGTYFPKQVDYRSASFNAGVELGAGVGPVSINSIVGVSGGLALSNVDVLQWPASLRGGDAFQFEGHDNTPFFAFKGDIGLHRMLASEGQVPRAEPAVDFSEVTGRKAFGLDAANLHELALDRFDYDRTEAQFWRPRLNKTIRCNTAHQMAQYAASVPFYQFDKRDFSNLVDYSSLEEDAITEFEIVDEAGMRYTFGLPVFERKKLQLSFSVGDLGQNQPLGEEIIFVDGPSVNDIYGGLSPKDWNDVFADWDNVHGKYIEQPVATSWLLTSITSPDYVDIQGDGCTEDDLGSWVVFHYQRLLGTDDKTASGGWFQFRDPVSGSRYSQGSEADSRDNMASFSCGQKEVYALEEIETRTHRARFITSPRADGASIDDLDAAFTADSWSQQGLHRLDTIQLFAKDQSGSATDALQQTIAFQYDYGSWPADDANQGGLSSGGAPGQYGGKLTLTGVTTSTYGVQEDARTAEFAYTYPEYQTGSLDVLPWMDDDHLQSKYADLFAEYADLEETPLYRHNVSNAWGVAREDTADYWSRHHAWYRPHAGGSSNSDPAAYCLKQVVMPSGVRILPQYERSEYRHVQDMAAEVMVPLSADSPDEHDRFFVDPQYLTQSLGWDMTPSEILAQLQDQLIGERTYLKPLYYMPATTGSPAEPGPGQPGWNYFPGFIRVTDVNLVNGLLEFQVETTGNYDLPQTTCREFCRKYPRLLTEDLDIAGFDEEELLSAASTVLDKAIQFGASQGPTDLLNCNFFDPTESYIRLPLLGGNSKPGGRPRIKRLLVHDPGILYTTGAGTTAREGELLTGTEYHYEAWDNDLEQWVSSGVAANEPKSMYEECALFEPLFKTQQLVPFKFLAGKDAETQSGPVGESFLPGPSVTYEQVTTRSIHDDVGGEGEIMTRFYSHRTHPLQVQVTNPYASKLKKVKPSPILSVLNPVTNKALWYSQGFRITTNDMAGRIAETVHYSAERDQNGTRIPVARTQYDYRLPGEPVALMNGVLTGSDSLALGAFDEAYTFGRFIRNHRWNAAIEHDIDGSFSFFGAAFVIPSIWPSGAILREVQGTHATVLQSHRPAMIRSITTEKSGMKTTVQNVAFDRTTGKPVLTATSDGFSDMEYNRSEGATLDIVTSASRKLDLAVSGIPAYPEEGRASRNDRLTLLAGEGLLSPIEEVNCRYAVFATGNQTQAVPYLEFCPDKGEDLCGILGEDGLFYPGDWLKISGINNQGFQSGFFHVTDVSGNLVYLEVSPQMPAAVPLYGAKIEVLSSGRSNMLGVNYAELTAYDEALNAVKVPNPAAEPFRELVDWLNQNAIPTPTANQSSITTNLIGQQGSWNDVTLKEAGCQAMNEPSIGLHQFHMEFSGNGCGMGYISFPHPVNLTFPPEPENIGGSNYTGSADAPLSSGANSGSPSAQPTVIPIHYNTDTRGPGSFSFDGELGAIVWTSPDAECSPTVVFTACDDFSDIVSVQNVMQASATSRSDGLERPPVSFGLQTFDDKYVFGGKGRWSPESTLVHNDTASSYLDGATHSTEVGIMDDFTLLSPYHISTAPTEWIKTSTNLTLDELGRVTQTVDALGYGHALRFNTADNRPIWTADGATGRSCAFESFESVDGDTLTDTDSHIGPQGNWTGERTDDQSHSGLYSWKFRLSDVCGIAPLPDITLDQKTWDQGLRIRFWAHEPRHGTTQDKKYSMDSLFVVGLHDHPLSQSSCNTALALEVKADSLIQTGRWVLIEGVIPPDTLAAHFTQGDVVHPVLSCDRSSQVQNVVYIDDVRVQPTQAVMDCAVFDPQDHRLLTEFDGNHFGRYYQYNHKGELIRTQIETEAGLKTVSETHEHVLEN